MVLIIPLRTNPAAYIIFVCCALACEGAHFSLFPSLCSRVYGKENGGQIFTFVFLSAPAAANASDAFYHLLGDKIFILLSSITAFNFVILFFFNEKPLLTEFH